MLRANEWHEHWIYASAPLVRKVCEPLFQYFNTSYFNFVRRFAQGSEACLTTDPAWTEYFYTNKLYKKTLTDIKVRGNSFAPNLKIYPWTQFSESPVRLAQSQLFGIGIGITLVFGHVAYTDFFHFGTHDRHEEMAEIYYNYAEYMIQFAHYLYDKGAKLIKEAAEDKNRLFFSDRRIHSPDQENPSMPNFDLERFIQAAQPRRFLVYGKTCGEVFLSLKEMQCINLLTRGKTAPEIGKALFISNRTVETHFRRVKEKLGLKPGANKADLITAIYQSGFDLNDLMPLEQI